MTQYKQIFMDHLDAKGVKYTDIDSADDNVVRVTYNGDDIKSVPVYIIFDDDGDPMAKFRCWEIANFKDKLETAYRLCNELNNQYRWVKFYIDKDGDIVCECDAKFNRDTCGEICLFCVHRIVGITDSAYKTIMREVLF